MNAPQSFDVFWPINTNKDLYVSQIQGSIPNVGLDPQLLTLVICHSLLKRICTHYRFITNILSYYINNYE